MAIKKIQILRIIGKRPKLNFRHSATSLVMSRREDFVAAYNDRFIRAQHKFHRVDVVYFDVNFNLPSAIIAIFQRERYILLVGPSFDHKFLFFRRLIIRRSIVGRDLEIRIIEERYCEVSHFFPSGVWTLRYKIKKNLIL